MDDRAFRRERMLASGLLREVSPDEAARLARVMEDRVADAPAAEAHLATLRPEPPPRWRILALAR